jgi:hypothetical protein
VHRPTRCFPVAFLSLSAPGWSFACRSRRGRDGLLTARLVLAVIPREAQGTGTTRAMRSVAVSANTIYHSSKTRISGVMRF